jgi:hypothetical protein
MGSIGLPICVDTFNKKVRQLVQILKGKNGGVLAVERLQIRVNLVIRETPFMLINEVGPELWVYREKIKSGDETFFLETFDTTQLEKGADQSAMAATEIRELISLVKAGYKTSSDNERKYIQKLVCELLGNYAIWERDHSKK